MNEKIISAFEKAGFDLEKSEMGYTFQYEGVNYLIDAGDENDNGFLVIFIPAIIKKKGLNELSFYKFIDLLNSKLRYIKVYELADSIWLSYERKLMSDDNLEVLIPDMINTLDLAIQFLQNLINDFENEYEEEEACDIVDSLVFNDLDSLHDTNHEKS